MKKGKYAIALLANDKYLEKTKQVFYSVVRYGNWTGDFLLLAYEINSAIEQLEWFHDRNIRVFHLSAHDFRLDAIPDPQKIYFSKLFLFHPTLAEWEKIIYFDVDMIIRKDIGRLLKYNDFAAANDGFQYPVIHQLSPPGKPYEEAEINKHYPQKLLSKVSFNSGLMVIQSRNNTLPRFDELNEFANKFGNYSVFFDQGILNLYFNESRKKIPYVFNDYFGSEPFNRQGLFRRNSDRDAVVLHIIHPEKPWSPSSPYYTEWQYNSEAALQSANYLPEGPKPSLFSIYKIELINGYNIKKIYFLGYLKNKISFFKWNIELIISKLSPLLKNFK